MKQLFIAFVGFSLSTLAFSKEAPITRSIEIQTVKVGEAVHWSPEKVEVSPGETVTFLIKHDLEGGFDFHGFQIRELSMTEKIDRHKTFKKTVTIPESMKPGNYPIGCQFHPKHVSATLVVKKK